MSFLSLTDADREAMLAEIGVDSVDEPETVNDDPYGEGWLIRIRLSEPAEADELLDAGAYRAFLAEQ